MRVQLLSAPKKGNLLDYTVGKEESLQLVALRLSASVPCEVTVLKGETLVEAFNIAAGIPWWCPQNEFERKQGLLGFTTDPVPAGSRILIVASAGPCYMRLWWNGGPEKF